METSTQPSSGDIIEDLPSDNTIPSHNELQIVDSLFEKNHNFIQKMLCNFKELVILFLLFIIFSLSSFDNIIKRFIKVTETSEYILLCVKALLFIFIFFIINNFHLSRK